MNEQITRKTETLNNLKKIKSKLNIEQQIYQLQNDQGILRLRNKEIYLGSSCLTYLVL